MEGLQKTARSVQPIRYNTGVWQTLTDRQTDRQTHNDIIYVLAQRRAVITVILNVCMS